MQINRMKMLDLRGTAEKRIGIHDFRRIHHYLVAAGANLKTVSSLMGHANAAMTLNTYANADLDARVSAMETIARQMAARPRWETRRSPVLSDSDAEGEVWELRVV
ncbi:MAG: tyrosine-type recombinase/integrase [Olsenella profusa]